GARLDVVNSDGITPVRLAALRGERELYDWLVAQNGGKEPSPAYPPNTPPPTDSIDESFKKLMAKDRIGRRDAQRRLVVDHERTMPELLRRLDAGESIDPFADLLAAMGPYAAAAIPRLAEKLADKEHAFTALVVIQRIQP